MLPHLPLKHLLCARAAERGARAFADRPPLDLAVASTADEQVAEERKAIDEDAVVLSPGPTVVRQSSDSRPTVSDSRPTVPTVCPTVRQSKSVVIRSGAVGRCRTCPTVGPTVRQSVRVSYNPSGGSTLRNDQQAHRDSSKMLSFRPSA